MLMAAQTDDVHTQGGYMNNQTSYQCTSDLNGDGWSGRVNAGPSYPAPSEFLVTNATPPRCKCPERGRVRAGHGRAAGHEDLRLADAAVRPDAGAVQDWLGAVPCHGDPAGLGKSVIDESGIDSSSRSLPIRRRQYRCREHVQQDGRRAAPGCSGELLRSEILTVDTGNFCL